MGTILREVVSDLASLDNQNGTSTESASKDPKNLIQILKLQARLFEAFSDQNKTSTANSQSSLSSQPDRKTVLNPFQSIFDIATCMELFKVSLQSIARPKQGASSSFDFINSISFQIEVIWPLLSQLSWLMELSDSIAKSSNLLVVASGPSGEEFDWSKFLLSSQEPSSSINNLFLFSNPHARSILLRTLKSYSLFRDWLLKIQSDLDFKKGYVERISRKRKEEVMYLMSTRPGFSNSGNMDTNGFSQFGNGSSTPHSNQDNGRLSLAVSQQLKLAKDSMEEILGRSSVDLDKLVERLGKNGALGMGTSTGEGEFLGPFSSPLRTGSATDFPRIIMSIAFSLSFRIRALVGYSLFPNFRSSNFRSLNHNFLNYSSSSINFNSSSSSSHLFKGGRFKL